MLKLIISSRDYNNVLRVLVNENGDHVKRGDCLGCTKEEGNIYIQGGAAPHKPESEGKIYVTNQDRDEREYYPSVYDLIWKVLN